MGAFKKWTGLFSAKLNDAYQTFQVCAPRDYFKRADAFIEDVRYLTKESLQGLNKAFLAKLLFDNFLEKIRQDEDLYDYLCSLSDAYGSLLHHSADSFNTKGASARELKSARGTPRFSWKMNSYPVKNEDNDHLALSIKLHASEVSRVEVFFDDLRWARQPLDMEIDELLSLLFIEFITAVRSGLTQETKEEIIDFILAKWEERG
ncbi:hypothetical protein [Paenibacillus rigui]|uniref:Uncharacterized protein n=1 Tax=Paenibacillus rigui TaxID=554312 RepID=A0A229UPP0_9BACL|nr:hypothetical protein [Paenibacillus rigui]OXM85330.1 hypothetical protein CF651_17245 [Paenibacillus rigui]